MRFCLRCFMGRVIQCLTRSASGKKGIWGDAVGSSLARTVWPMFSLRARNALAAFRATMTWSSYATNDEKVIVHGNLNGFVAFLRANHYVLAGPHYPNSQED